MRKILSQNQMTRRNARRCSCTSRKCTFPALFEVFNRCGKRTLKSDLPSDKHLFPDSFHKAVHSEHDHSRPTASYLQPRSLINRCLRSRLPITIRLFVDSPLKLGPSNQRKRNWGNRWINSKRFAKTKIITYYNKDKS